MDAGEFLDILQSCPGLVSAEIHGAAIYSKQLYELAIQGEKVELSSLRSLLLKADATPSYDLGSLLRTIHTPNLESLTICTRNSGFSGDPEDIPNAQTLQLPVYSALRILTLRRINCADIAANFDFSHLRALECISIPACKSPMSLLRILRRADGNANSSCYWPLLRSIILAKLEPQEVDELCDIISYRKNCGRPLESVEVHPELVDFYPAKVEWMKLHVNVKLGPYWQHYTHLSP